MSKEGECRVMEPLMGNTEGSLKPVNVSTKQQRIAKLARQSPRMSFMSLNHYLDMEWVREAYRRLKKSSAPGYDRKTVKQYGRNLEENLMSLLDRAKSGNYFAPPVKRVYIPKDTGKETRPIGIPTTEDKLLEKAIQMLLEPIYEQDFLDCSYGFRPKRSAHQALEVIWRRIMGMGGAWVLHVDIRRYFDTVDHACLRKLLRLRVRDGVVVQLIGKWLNAGVLEEGKVSYPEQGTPQGSGISPLLSNLYLHYVLDTWIEQVVKPRMKGDVELVRFCDDAIILFSQRDDAERVLEVLPKRFAKYGLTINQEKTELVGFINPQRKNEQPASFDFLGFTHYWGKSQKGRWIVKRKTAAKRFRRALVATWNWCRKNRHKKVKAQYEILRSKIRGHYNYYGITGNFRSLSAYWHYVKRAWRYWLNRRNRGRSMPWSRFNQLLLQCYPLPRPNVVHSIYAVKP